MSPNLTEQPLAKSILDRVEAVLLAAEQARRPVEMDPYRGQLFELFVTADGAGYLKPEAEVDLTADNLCRLLGEKWGLADATRESANQEERLPQMHLAKMRLLWSMLRMWMEWQYAWDRWQEFHAE